MADATKMAAEIGEIRINGLQTLRVGTHACEYPSGKTERRVVLACRKDDGLVVPYDMSKLDASALVALLRKAIDEG
jgi:hypothetical protein